MKLSSRLPRLANRLATSAVVAWAAIACGGTADLGGTTPAPATGPVSQEPAPGESGKEQGGSPSAPPKPVAVGGLDPDLALRAATFIGTCVPDDLTNRFLDRMYTERGGESLDQLIRSSLGCFATKTNACAAVTECLGVTVSVIGACTQGCDGNAKVLCADQRELRVDCTATGETCTDVAGKPLCAPGVAKACDYTTYASSCQGGRPSWCGRIESLGPTCADLGLSCTAKSNAPSPAVHVCAGTGPACTSTSGYGPVTARHDGIACNGASTLRACINTFEAAVECGSVSKDFTCQTKGGTSFCGLASECAPGAASKPTCEGNSLVVCNAGKIAKVDCTSLGFPGCDAAHGMCSPP